MGKIYIEDQEIIIKERDIVGDEQHIIDNSKYISRAVVRKEFESSIFSYGDLESILVSQLYLFGESYYKIVFFHDALQKAWKLVEVSSELEVRVKRMDKDYFFVAGDGKASEEVASQISFCRLKPSTMVETITISFTKLNDVQFIKSRGAEYILVCYSDKRDGRIYHTLAIYNHKGKCEKTFYEYCKEDGVSYRYEVIDKEKINIIKTDPSLPAGVKPPQTAPKMSQSPSSAAMQRATVTVNQPEPQKIPMSTQRTSATADQPELQKAPMSMDTSNTQMSQNPTLPGFPTAPPLSLSDLQNLLQPQNGPPQPSILNKNATQYITQPNYAPQQGISPFTGQNGYSGTSASQGFVPQPVVGPISSGFVPYNQVQTVSNVTSPQVTPKPPFNPTSNK